MATPFPTDPYGAAKLFATIPNNNGALSASQMAAFVSALNKLGLQQDQLQNQYNYNTNRLAEMYGTGQNGEVLGEQTRALQTKNKNDFDSMLAGFSRGMRGYVAQGIRQRNVKNLLVGQTEAWDAMQQARQRALADLDQQRNLARGQIDFGVRDVFDKASSYGADRGVNLFGRYY